MRHDLKSGPDARLSRLTSFGLEAFLRLPGYLGLVMLAETLLRHPVFQSGWHSQDIGMLSKSLLPIFCFLGLRGLAEAARLTYGVLASDYWIPRKYRLGLLWRRQDRRGVCLELSGAIICLSGLLLWLSLADVPSGMTPLHLALAGLAVSGLGALDRTFFELSVGTRWCLERLCRLYRKE